MVIAYLRVGTSNKELQDDARIGLAIRVWHSLVTHATDSNLDLAIHAEKGLVLESVVPFEHIIGISGNIKTFTNFENSVSAFKHADHLFFIRIQERLFCSRSFRTA
jgi:hypothetical protein